jgi:hypothetical protein
VTDFSIADRLVVDLLAGAGWSAGTGMTGVAS